MKVRVQFFAQLRNVAGASEIDVDLPENSSVGELLTRLYESKPALRSHDQTILVGAGLEFVDRDYKIQPEDMIAIMPPVQGG
jgi:molybdopterin converting factor small subunit